jgi:uroporphyrinogen decarboxylase
MHVCGSFQQLIPSMHACGIDAVQSLQPVNEGMDVENLKNYKDVMIFNGCIDSVNKLIYGTKEACIEETKRVVNVMKPGGGYILSPSHDYLLEMTPVENVLAMYDTCFEMGAY